MRVHVHTSVHTSVIHDVGVRIDGEVLPAEAVVVALGPWTNTLASSLPLPHISGQMGHSIVLKPSCSSSDTIPADCLFLSWQSKSGEAVRDSNLDTSCIVSDCHILVHTKVVSGPVGLTLTASGQSCISKSLITGCVRHYHDFCCYCCYACLPCVCLLSRTSKHPVLVLSL